jgi:hypothetical protein
MSCERTTSERMVEIEDRKIEILLEIGRANKRYGKAVSRFESEYERLDVEHFRLKMEMMKEGQY